MVLKIIEQEIKKYKEFMVTSEYDEFYKWEALKNFNNNWDIEAEDFKKMYNDSFSSNNNNLWTSFNWLPKMVMLKFIDYDKERVRQMFRDLYDEQESIDRRFERFVFSCDNIIKEIYTFDKSMKNHFHDGQRMVSLYLAFKFPNKYAIYKFKEFKTFMEIVKAGDIPGTGEYERFFKVVRTIYNILIKDEELVKIHKTLLNEACYKNETLMLAQDFIFITARLNPR